MGTFHWPSQISTILDRSSGRIMNKRCQIEEELKARVADFEKKIEGYGKEVESFRKKELMRQDEMRNNVEVLSRLQVNLESAREELEGLQEEERLLEWDITEFPQLNNMFALKEPYDKLWRTAYNFNLKNESWTNGPFKDRNSEEIENEVQEMWRTMYKLTKTFSDQPGPRHIATNVKAKIDKFK